MNLIASIFIFIGSIVLISWGADKVIDTIKEASEKLNLSAVGLAFFVMGVDLEESIASWSAATVNLPEIALGNVIGNSIISITFCFAFPALLFPIAFHKIDPRYFLFLITLGLVNTAAILWPSLWLIWVILIFGIYFLYVGWNFWSIKHQKGFEEQNIPQNNEEPLDEENEHEEKSIWKDVILGVIGLVVLILGSKFLVESVQSLLALTNLSEGFFGVGIIAASTNVEEYFLLIKSIKKKKVEIGIAGLLGKIMWNLGINSGISLLIIGIKYPTFTDFKFSLLILLNTILLAAILLPLLTFVGVKKKKLVRGGGILFLFGFLLYLAMLFWF